MFRPTLSFYSYLLRGNLHVGEVSHADHPDLLVHSVDLVVDRPVCGNRVLLPLELDDIALQLLGLGRRNQTGEEGLHVVLHLLAVVLVGTQSVHLIEERLLVLVTVLALQDLLEQLGLSRVQLLDVDLGLHLGRLDLGSLRGCLLGLLGSLRGCLLLLADLGSLDLDLLHDGDLCGLGNRLLLDRDILVVKELEEIGAEIIRVVVALADGVELVNCVADELLDRRHFDRPTSTFLIRQIPF